MNMIKKILGLLLIAGSINAFAMDQGPTATQPGLLQNLVTYFYSLWDTQQAQEAPTATTSTMAQTAPTNEMDVGQDQAEVSPANRMLIEAIRVGSVDKAINALALGANPEITIKNPESIFEDEPSITSPLNYLHYKKHFSNNKESYNQIIKLFMILLKPSPNKELSISAEIEDLDLMEYALSKEADINNTEKGGSTPLSIAAYHGQNNIVTYLLSQPSIDANKESERFGPPLNAAVFSKDNNETVKVLLKDIRTNESSVNSAFNTAIENQFYSTALIIMNDHRWAPTLKKLNEALVDIVYGIVDSIEPMPDYDTAKTIISSLLTKGAQPGKIRIKTSNTETDTEEEIGLVPYLMKHGKIGLARKMLPI